MSHLSRTLAAACGLALLLFAAPAAHAAPRAPVIFSVSESQDTTSGAPSLVLLGSRLSIFRAFELKDDGGADAGTVTRRLRSRTMLVLALPAGLDSGEYDLVFTYGPRRRPQTLTHRITLRQGGALWTESNGNLHRAAGRVGIGETDPAADLHVDGTDGVLFTGTRGQGTIPAEGAGTRMMWHPEKAALRVGDVDGSQWDDANVGVFSLATGDSTTASGSTSTAMGFKTTASGHVSTAMGHRTTASGGYGSTAMGHRTTASGYYTSTAMGSGTTASGNISTAMGYGTTASGIFSTAMGYGTTASGTASTAMGVSTTAQPYTALVIGRYNVIAGSTSSWVVTDPLFVAGNGSSTSARSNALTLLKNGNMTIAGTLTQNSDARLKRDIEPLDGVLGKLEGISGVTYRFKDETTHPAGLQVGLLAQQVQEAFPELVSEGPDGTLSVAYGKFTAVLLEAVREQQDEIEARDAEVAQLRQELAKSRREQNDRLARLEALLSAGGEKAK